MRKALWVLGTYATRWQELVLVLVLVMVKLLHVLRLLLPLLLWVEFSILPLE